MITSTWSAARTFGKISQALDKYFPGISEKDVHAAIDAAYDEYERHMAQVRVKGSEIIAGARRSTATLSCWRAAPTMWTRRSTTASTSSSSARALPWSPRIPSAGYERSSTPPC